MQSHDEDDEAFERFYENGHWDWDDITGSLVFKSDAPHVEEDLEPPTSHNIAGTIEFKEDLELLEQQRFRKVLQRKQEDNDRVRLQDVKDIACFTAPKNILTPAMINILHMPRTERFLRALLLYCQYYLQVADEMGKRFLELELKIRTPASDDVESQYRENLQDLRLVVAKEYACIIIGTGDLAKYHHMGKSKKQRSLSKRDAILVETLLRITIQIVWLALGRKSYNKLELEINRLFKSEIYNITEHNLNTKYMSQLSQREILVLFGHCVRRNSMPKALSPLNNEMHCQRVIDYRIFGLGVVKYPRLSPRLRYIERALIAPEEDLENMKVSLGILGLLRSRFDTMLNEIKMPVSTSASSTSTSRQSMGRLVTASKSSRVSASMKKSNIQHKIYDDIFLPEDDEEESLPDQFPDEVLPKNVCDQEQRKKWLSYTSRNMAGKKTKLKKTLPILKIQGKHKSVIIRHP